MVVRKSFLSKTKGFILEHRTGGEAVTVQSISSTRECIDYWELREQIKRIIPRQTVLHQMNSAQAGLVKEKGRKTNYKQFNLQTGEWDNVQRLLNETEVNSFLEVSLRAAACPMPLNLDVWDGLKCPFRCKYCFADYFRASLYTSFFDNSKSIGLRHCNPDYYKKELDKLFDTYRYKDPHSINNEIGKAIALKIPMRLGIRFEDFTPREKREGVSLALLQYLSERQYPVMINTKSHLVGEEAYVEALASNSAKAAVHMTMISCDEDFLKKVEPGAPCFQKRIDACRNLSLGGVRVVARIEPYMVFLNDSPTMLSEYMDALKYAKIKHITFDTYSYSAYNPGIRQNFLEIGLDFDRMFLLGSDSQGIGSLLLDSYMDLFRRAGFKCSTFDLGNVPNNSQLICCEVGDLWRDCGFNYGSAVPAARFIVSRGNCPTTWNDFAEYVEQNGGFLSKRLKMEVKQLWNVDGNWAYAVNWGAGIEPAGRDEDGMIWKYESEIDFRKNLLNSLII